MLSLSPLTLHQNVTGSLGEVTEDVGDSKIALRDSLVKSEK